MKIVNNLEYLYRKKDSLCCQFAKFRALNTPVGVFLP